MKLNPSNFSFHSAEMYSGLKGQAQVANKVQHLLCMILSSYPQIQLSHITSSHQCHMGSQVIINFLKTNDYSLPNNQKNRRWIISYFEATILNSEERPWASVKPSIEIGTIPNYKCWWVIPEMLSKPFWYGISLRESTSGHLHDIPTNMEKGCMGQNLVEKWWRYIWLKLYLTYVRVFQQGHLSEKSPKKISKVIKLLRSWLKINVTHLSWYPMDWLWSVSEIYNQFRRCLNNNFW